MTNDLIQDVENAMREERNLRLWREYGPYILAGAVLAVILTAGISGWRAWNDHVDTRNTGLLLQAEKAKDEPAALTALDPKLREGQRTLARFTSIGALLKDGKSEEALKSYRLIAGDTKTPAFFRDLALLLSTRLDWSLHKDKARARTLLDTLRPLEGDGNPWRGQAMIAASGIMAHGLGDMSGAAGLLQPLIDDKTAPDPLRQQAEALAHVYKLQSVKP